MRTEASAAPSVIYSADRTSPPLCQCFECVGQVTGQVQIEIRENRLVYLMFLSENRG